MRRFFAKSVQRTIGLEHEFDPAKESDARKREEAVINIKGNVKCATNNLQLNKNTIQQIKQCWYKV